MSKVEAQGGKGGQSWDDGAYDGVRKIDVGVGADGIQYIKFDYDKSGQPTSGAVHGVKDNAMTQTFEIKVSDEYIVSVEGYYDNMPGYDAPVIQALQFKTNQGRTSDVFGFEMGTKFSLGVEDKKIVGFHGYAEKVLHSLGAYFAPISSSSSSANKLEAQGGTGGTSWDDGVYDGVRKVYVGQGDSGVTFVKFEYDKGGKLEAQDHGKMTLLGTEEFELDYPNEHITSVEGYYDKILGNDTPMITSLRFKTSKQRTSEPFGIEAGTRFVLEDKGGKLVGFHGRAGDVLHSLGAYFAPLPTPLTPANKLEAQGGTGGTSWDDGVYDGVRKVYVGQGDSGVTFVKFEYDKGGKLEAQDHGKMTLLGVEEFELDYPGEYITSVEGYHDKILGNDTPVITSLRFTTSKQRTSPPFGIEAGTRFVLEDKGGKLVGFHGRSGDVIHSLGAYFAPLSTPLTPAKKLQAQGGDGGSSWDDGAYDGVRKVYIGQGDSSITFVKFEYDKGAQLVTGDDHGQKTLLGTEEFELNYPSEYITSVEGYYDKILGSDTPIITSLRFKTNQRTSPPFGIEAGTQFVLEEKDSKIVGFHGQASDKLHKFGVHVMPVSN